MDTENECVCAVQYYQTSPATDSDPPGCTACPPGTTTADTNSQDIDACCKYDTIIIPIPRYQHSILFNGF